MRRGVIMLLGMLWLAFRAMAQTAGVEFSHRGGFYERSFDLTLTCGDQHLIRYTTNGATPTAHSTRYTGPIHLDETLYSVSDIFTIPTAIDELFYCPESVRH